MKISRKAGVMDLRKWLLIKRFLKYTSCFSVKKIKAENREDVTDTRDNIIAKGFDPCGNCHP